MREAQEKIETLRRDDETNGHSVQKSNIYKKEVTIKYFHLIANGKHRRKKIFQLEQDEGTIIGQENIKKTI
jgi:hypothetical protein